MNWKVIGFAVPAALGILTFLGGTATYTYSAVGNDPMPLEGKKQAQAGYDALRTEFRADIMDALDRIEAREIGTQILIEWHAQCDAQRAKQPDVAQVHAETIAHFQSDYQTVANGRQFPIGACP